MSRGYISSVLPVEQPNIKKKHIFSFITFFNILQICDILLSPLFFLFMRP